MAVDYRSIVGVFKGLGKSLAAAGKFLARFISDAQVDLAVGIVKEAAGQFLDNEERRKYAVAKVRERSGVPESVAQWLVSTAVIAVKAELAEQIDKVAEEVKASNDPSTDVDNNPSVPVE